MILNTKFKKIAALSSIAVIGTLGLTACNSESEKASREVYEKSRDMKPYIPKNDVELRNYTKAQEIYDDPTVIQWCSLFPPSNSAPIITVPIAGKLTTSSTSYFGAGEKSVDGLFHGDSFYRMGFTPGGEYADVSNSMPMFCSTALTEFQRQKTYVDGLGTNGDANKVDVDALQKKAENALKSDTPDDAAKILRGDK